jgi:tetratricopeptide (TPR) repeat protein
MLSILFLIPVIILVSLLHRGEHDMYKLRGSLNPAPGANNKVFKDYAYETLKNPFLSEFSKLDAAISLGKAGYPKEAVEIIENVYSADPRNLDALRLLASTSEQVKEVTKAIEYRNNIARLDPWNAENYLQLGRLYKSIGDTGGMELILSKILSFAPNSDQGKLAKVEFTLSD